VLDGTIFRHGRKESPRDAPASANAPIMVNKMLTKGEPVFDATISQPRTLSRRDAAKMLRDELAHFERCPMCAQFVDRRDIHAVMHHLPVGHQPTLVH
jgi:hypothetical protein